jgi:hypothetical protein
MSIYRIDQDEIRLSSLLAEDHANPTAKIFFADTSLFCHPKNPVSDMGDSLV